MTVRRSRKRAGKPNPRTRVRKKPLASDAVKYPAEVLREMERGLDRYIERWARKLIFVADGEVRKLTEDEVQAVVRKSRPKAKSGTGQGPSTRSPRVQRGIATKKNRRTR